MHYVYRCADCRGHVRQCQLNATSISVEGSDGAIRQTDAARTETPGKLIGQGCAGLRTGDTALFHRHIVKTQGRILALFDSDHFLLLLCHWKVTASEVDAVSGTDFLTRFC